MKKTRQQELRINCNKLSLSVFVSVFPANMRGSVAVFLCLWVVIAHAETPESSTFGPTIPNKTPAPGQAPEGMVWVPGGEFSMGASTNGHGTDESQRATNATMPVQRVRVGRSTT